MEFEWHEAKADSNLIKHGISFEEAGSIWNDVYAYELVDEAHSRTEDRFLRIGISAATRLLTVVYCERGIDAIRIISARKANIIERQEYSRRLHDETK